MELSRHLREDMVGYLRLLPPRFVCPEEPISVAVDLMRREGVGCLLVTRHGRLEGIFTEKDLLTRVLACGRSLASPVAASMTINPATIRLRDSIHAAIRRMERGGYRRLPVLDESSRPVGIVSVKHIIQYLAEHFPSLVYNQPPESRCYPDMAEGA